MPAKHLSTGTLKGAVLRQLLALDKDMIELDGDPILSVLLGVAMTGYHDEDDSDVSFGSFNRGIWDGLLAEAKPVVI